MRLTKGLYKVPEMFPSNFSFPGGYKITNLSNSGVRVEHLDSLRNNIFTQYLAENESLCSYIQEGHFLIVDKDVEIVRFNPED